ncbi:MAG: hypothetical protein ACRYF0_13020 [Janthinobacterium lividum]
MLTSGLAAGGYAYRRGQASQNGRLACIGALTGQISVNNEQRAEANSATGRRIAHYVCLNHSQPADLAVLNQTQQIQARTQGLVDTVNLLRQQLRSAPASAYLTNALSAQLDRYTAFIQRYASETVLLTRPSAATAPEGWFGQVELIELPLPAVRAALGQLEARLRRWEARALQTQAEKMSSNWDGFDTIHVLAVPTTESVAPGGDYQARLFLAQFGHQDLCNMEMTANSVPLTQPSGPGMQVQFAVPARQPGQPDTVRAYWRGTIRGGLFPSDTVLQLDVPYFIVQRPTL